MSSIIEKAVEWYLKKKRVKIEPEVTEIIFEDTVIELVTPYVDLSLLRLRLSGSIKVNLRAVTITGVEEKEE